MKSIKVEKLMIPYNENTVLTGKSVIMFGKAHCNACTFMKKTMNELITEGYKVYYVNVSLQSELMYEFEIPGFPTFTFMNDNKEYERIIGSARKYDFYLKLNGEENA